MLSSRRNLEQYIHLFLGPSSLILVCLIVAFNADAIARFICRDDEDLSFGHVSGHELAKIGVSLLAIFILVAGVSSFIYSTTNFMLLEISGADTIKAQIKHITYFGACVRFIVQVVLGSYLLLKSNRVATFISKREPEPTNSE
ncbi:MAG: hypothetical protein Hens2KO_06140 [Henriciella sp.]